jgi:hypothetical protein
MAIRAERSQIAGLLVAEAFIGAVVNLQLGVSLRRVANSTAEVGSFELSPSGRTVAPIGTSDVCVVIHESFLHR